MKSYNYPDQNTIERLRALSFDIASKLGNFACYQDIEDLASAGFYGALKWYPRYHPNGSQPLDKFLYHRCKYAILDEFRKWDTLSRGKRFRKRVIDQTREDLAQTLGRNPRIDELALELSMDENKLAEIMFELEAAATPLSLNEIVFSDDGDSDVTKEYFIPSIDESPATLFARQELYAWIRDSVKSLKHIYHHVIIRYYFDNMTLSEIAKQLGVTEARICQIKGAAIHKLRVMLFKCGITGELAA